MSYLDNYEQSGIKDYITLEFGEATITESDFSRTFDIPSSAYLNQNGSEYCLVSCEHLDVIFVNNNKPFILSIEGVQNSWCTSNPSSSLVQQANAEVIGALIASVSSPFRADSGGFQGGGSQYTHRFTKNTLKYKMCTRPRQIKLHTYTYNNAGRISIKNVTGSITLCFEYLSRKQVLAQELKSSYTPAF
tara:strand:- start:167 stop:736 length:570 start_codon:yes stop_codon:yes gene_type:complete